MKVRIIPYLHRSMIVKHYIRIQPYIRLFTRIKKLKKSKKKPSASMKFKQWNMFLEKL